MNKLEDYQIHTKELTPSLFNNTDINFFSYTKYHSDSTGVYLSSDPRVNDKLIKQNVASPYSRLTDLHNQNKKCNTLHNVFYSLPKEDNQKANNIIKGFGYKNTFILMDFFDDYMEHFVFSSTKTDMLRFCLSDFEMLVQFKNNFNRRAKSLIDNLDKYRLPFCDNNNTSITQGEPNNMDFKFNKKKFMQATKCTHYYVNHKGKKIEITAREFDCLKLVSQGRSNKETAKILDIAVTTILNHQEALKRKFSVIHRSELVDIYLASDLIVL